MSLKHNYHMHTELCGHAKGTILDNILEGISLGYETLGFSEHAPLPLEAFSKEDNKRLYAYENMTLDIMHKSYIEVLKKYREEYRDKINIKIGLESEYLKGYDLWYKNLKSEVEYMVLGVHFFYMNDKIVDTYSEINKESMLYYANTVEEALQTGLFKILAHPDLYLYDNIEFDDTAKIVADRIVDAAIKNNVLIEINCNGKGRYPREEFYRYIKDKKGAKFIIGVDSHDPKRLSGDHILESIKLAKKYNLNLTSEV